MPRRRRLPPGFWPAPFRGETFSLLPLGWAAFAAIIAGLVMPQQSPFPYRFEKSHPWSYPTLKAPFDFEVLHPEELVRDELAKVEAEHAPYFVVQPETVRQQKRKLETLLNDQVRISRNDTQYEDLLSNPTAYLGFGRQLLDQIYDRGIGDPEMDELLQTDPSAHLYLVEGRNEKRVPAASLFTLRSAQNFLTDSLPYSPLRQPELLLSLLEKTLTPNVLYSDSLTNEGKRRKIAAVISTGITVRKGEVIVRKNELITEDIYRKLDSLSHRYDVPKGFGVAAGYAILAFLLFSCFFYWLQREHPAIWQQREATLLLPLLVSGLLALLSFTSWMGSAVALLIPLWGLPVLLDRKYEPRISWLIWLITTTLGTVSLDWGAGWLAIQIAGATGVYLLPYFRSGSWTARACGAAISLAFQVLAWAACILAGKMPTALQTADVVLFLLAANGFLLLFFPLSRILEK